jgi:hypothetical protein
MVADTIALDRSRTHAGYAFLKNFINFTRYILKKDGVFLMNSVNSDFYNNMFRFDHLVQELKVSHPQKYIFNLKDCPPPMHIPEPK